MIISVSRRTDISAFYGEWFMNRLKEGFVCVRNPFNKNMISKISLNKDIVDCFVFWTKDACNFIKYLPQIDEMGYKYYFQFTVTPYDKIIEPNLREKNQIIKTFIELSKAIGKEKVIWRYDPILLTKEITIQWHIKKFEEMCKQIANFTDTVIISFLDEYKKLNKSKFKSPNTQEMLTIGEEFSKIAKKYNLKIKTCAEEIVFTNGIESASCIDKDLIEKICGHKLNVKKDTTQRQNCLCVQSVDIGEYDTCAHFCEYCYANNNCKVIKEKLSKHNSNSPLLVGDILSHDKIYERKVESLRK